MHEVVFKFTVSGAKTDQRAIDMAFEYFCGGDYYRQVTQHDAEVRKLPDVQESEATEA